MCIFYFFTAFAYYLQKITRNIQECYFGIGVKYLNNVTNINLEMITLKRSATMDCRFYYLLVSLLNQYKSYLNSVSNVQYCKLAVSSEVQQGRSGVRDECPTHGLRIMKRRDFLTRWCNPITLRDILPINCQVTNVILN